LIDFLPEVAVPLYSSLPPMQQQKIFEPAPGPRFPGAPSGRFEVVEVGSGWGSGRWTVDL